MYNAPGRKAMNRERILHLAETIEKQEFVPINEGCDAASGFNMSHWFYPCGAPACIAGWAIFLFPAQIQLSYDGDHIYRAARLLGISNSMGTRLFEPRFMHADVGILIPGSPGFITARHAAAVLRHLVETGEVDWTVGSTLKMEH